MALSSAPSAVTVKTSVSYSFSSFSFAESKVDSVLPVITILAPAFANAVERPKPMPLPPPVMITTYPSNLIIKSLLKIYLILQVAKNLLNARTPLLSLLNTDVLYKMFAHTPFTYSVIIEFAFLRSLTRGYFFIR